jgi:hypothetical protein
MNSRAVRLISSACLIGCFACSASGGLSERGKRVTYVTNVLDVSGCDRIGEVYGDGVNVSEHDALARINAEHELRNAAGEKGGTHVLVVDPSTSLMKQGQAYKCP